MRVLGLDLGTKTLGVAVSDLSGMIATSIGVLRHDENYDALLLLLEEIIRERQIGEIVLGFPKNMNNTIGPRGEITLQFQKKLEEKFQLPVYMQDERLTTRQAEMVLLQNDTSRKKRKKVIDGMAATIILQSYLDKKGRNENGR